MAAAKALPMPAADLLVPAGRARDHIHGLAMRGVGLRAIADASDVSRTTLQEIRRGKRCRISPKTERAILDIDAGAMADHALISAWPTLQTIRSLLEEGYTEAWLAAWLGYNIGRIPFLYRKRVTALTAARVKCLALRLESGEISR